MLQKKFTFQCYDAIQVQKKKLKLCRVNGLFGADMQVCEQKHLALECIINKTEQITSNLNENVNSGSDNMMASAAATRILMVKMGERTGRHRKLMINTLVYKNTICTSKVPPSVLHMVI
jgi:hypothetical protein